ncbi:MAG: TIGR03960 family B12-binding radical SAM protein [Candidatus Omnitrophota bacterium]
MTSLKQLLDKVQKPGRYIGGETNSVSKRFSPNMVSVAMAYPDTYEVGMSYLGLIILYHLLNEYEDIACERVFMPAEDMTRELVNCGRKLFSLETKRDINKFDIVGFSLSYELTYTNVLSMLHLAGITVLSEDRKDEEPLIIAGGACCYNPEPMSAFIDVFIIGDAEEALVKFVQRYKSLKKTTRNRKNILRELSFLDGVYVPSFYVPAYSGRKFLALKPMDKDIPVIVKKNTVKDFENAYYPVKQIVPLIKIVHDRITVEIMRGCPNKCRFCQASAVNRPVRIRGLEKIVELCQDTYKYTGYERISLLSLSSVDYPRLPELMNRLNAAFRSKGVGISVPSLRIDESFYELPEIISSVRKTGLTFAPESASREIRKAIDKDLDFTVLCKSALIAFKHGWNKLKLYFMAGFPGEVEPQAEGIAELALELSSLKRTVSNGAAEIKISVNPFVPKPQTPFQWLGMKKKEELLKIKEALTSKSSRKINIEFHDLAQSMLEGALARGDREISRVIYSAWKNGATMDSWNDFFRMDIWQNAFKENGLDMEECACKRYDLRDTLPWSHIKTDVRDEFLKEGLKASGF